MSWFKNLQTATKLLIGFGIMALLMGVVGWQGITGMAQIDAKLESLYQNDMQGLAAIKDINASVAQAGRQVRGAVLDTEPAAMEQDRQKFESLMREAEDSIKSCERTFVTTEGKALVAQLKAVLPRYHSICAETIRVAMTNDKKAALGVLKGAVNEGNQVLAIAKAASDMKQNRGRVAFDESKQLYNSTRTFLFSLILGAMALAVGLGIFISNLIARPLGRAVGVLEAVAAGDLTQHVDSDTHDEVGRLSTALNTAVDGMRSTLNDVRSSAEGLASAAQQLASSSEELSSGAQEQAASLEETSASLEQITSSVKQNADSARQANQLAAASRETAEKGGTVVTSAVTAMSEINSSSKKIADIITAIDEIAFQTNLLALNAAVEAARAGEQGRGFAVVAAEVRTLAQRSATAAKEIKSLIQDSVRKVDAGSQMVNQSGDVLQQIVSSVKRVTDIVGEIAAASREQSAGVDQVSQAMSQVDQVTQQNASATEELSATAQTLASNADQLRALVARFRLGEGYVSHPVATAKPVQSAKPRKALPRPKTAVGGLSNLARKVGTSHEEELLPLDAIPTSDQAKGGFGEF